MIPHPGLFVKAALNWALRLDLANRSQWIDLQIGKRECTFPIATWVVTFVAKYVLGLEWYTDLLTALQEEPLRELVKLKDVPSDRSISRGHEGLHPRVMKRAYRDWLELKRTGRLSGRLIHLVRGMLPLVSAPDSSTPLNPWKECSGLAVAVRKEELPRVAAVLCWHSTRRARVSCVGAVVSSVVED